MAGVFPCFAQHALQAPCFVHVDGCCGEGDDDGDGGGRVDAGKNCRLGVDSVLAK